MALEDACVNNLCSFNIAFFKFTCPVIVARVTHVGSCECGATRVWGSSGETKYLIVGESVDGVRGPPRCEAVLLICWLIRTGFEYMITVWGGLGPGHTVPHPLTGTYPYFGTGLHLKTPRGQQAHRSPGGPPKVSFAA